jgi:branched-chain amino acid transport system ATP-binding protein
MAPLLEVRDVTVQFGGLVAVAGVSLDVEPRQVRAIIGPNGAGKTTLFNAITGHAAVTTGTIKLRGENLVGLAPHTISLRGLRRTFQIGGLFGGLTVLENVLTGLHTEIASGFFGVLVGRPRALRLERAATVRARRLLELTGIAHLADQPAKDLSGGQQRIVEIARALATNPPLLLLDEPTVGLAPPIREQLLRLIRRLVEQQGLAVLLIEHAIEFVTSASDSIVVMSEGKVIADVTPDELPKNRDVVGAYLGR